MSRENKTYEIDGKVIYECRTIATALVIYRGSGKNTEILAIRRGPAVKGTGNWSIPCGYLNWDESIYESACREAYEETGIVINPKDITLVDVYDQYKTRKQNVVLYFVTKYNGKDYVIPQNPLEFSREEVTDIEWINIYSGDQKKISKTAKRIVRNIKNSKIKIKWHNQ